MTTESELAVNRYLAWLADPSSAIDNAKIAQAEAAFSQASTPIERLHAAADVVKAKTADEEGIEAGFIASAKTYAKEQDIPAAAFIAVGVPADVLSRAGLGPSKGRSRRASSGPRAQHVSANQIKAVINQLPKRFTLADASAKAGGGSPITVRKAIDELIAEGRVVLVGPAPDHAGPGRAPTVFEQV